MEQFMADYHINLKTIKSLHEQNEKDSKKHDDSLYLEGYYTGKADVTGTIVEWLEEALEQYNKRPPWNE